MSNDTANYIPEVRAQYEELPYPHRRPKDEKHRLVTSFLGGMDAVNHHCFNGRADFNDFKVLVAGGGTGDSTIFWAEQLRGRGTAHVTQIDISDASLDIARQRAKVRGLDNITFINDSLLNLPDLDLGPFDFIDCSGVLHHLKDPDAGLKALQSVLKPEGAMYIMVYAMYGRRAIYEVQELMRLVNAGQVDNAKDAIGNTRKILQSLPAHHWYNISKQIGWHYGNFEDDAEILDMFLHVQDRAYTIDQIHDWAARCGLSMTSEPGSRYTQLHYLPETFVTDRDLLSRINSYPLPHQQAIAELMSTKIAQHECFLVNAGRDDTVADMMDGDMIPAPGTSPGPTFTKLADIAVQNGKEFTVTVEDSPSKPVIAIPQGRYIPALLRLIDGKRDITHIIAGVLADPVWGDKPPQAMDVYVEFTRLMTSLIRGHAAYLRAPSVAPYPTIASYEARVKAL